MAGIRVLSVCSHNRTRSVLIGALLAHHAAERGIDISVSSAGFADEGLPATTRAVDALASLGIDASEHASRRATASVVEWADLIVTAERCHVVEIAGTWPNAFVKTATLPEVIDRAERYSRRRLPTGTGPAHWLERLNDGRPTGLAYLDATDIGEIRDPLDDGPAGFRRCLEDIDELAARLAGQLAFVLPPLPPDLPR